MAAGYSGTPLLKKLGIVPGMKILLINQPDEYFSFFETAFYHQLCKKQETPDLVHLFARSSAEFEKEMNNIKTLINKNPSLVTWVSWYKKSANMATDLTEDRIRNYALENKLVDIKVCAVSELWSGLKLVVPLRYRP